MLIYEEPWDKLCVKFACDYDEARYLTDNFSSQTLLELMCFKLFQLS